VAWPCALRAAGYLTRCYAASQRPPDCTPRRSAPRATGVTTNKCGHPSPDPRPEKGLDHRCSTSRRAQRHRYDVPLAADTLGIPPGDCIKIARSLDRYNLACTRT
jgi:hypothetical protein